ncbi:hypothetical protein CRM22_010480 [Opisthorchis felineus]|uniref:Myotubularin phosphatase domain-containing protein n=1 Tax=Opisthorchis felineus TaxID=147828 RepID=A0A4S2L3S4_OPIFE|nr:hypothetical protein CRM22_010480 [Opisthorchis felineus]
MTRVSQNTVYLLPGEAVLKEGAVSGGKLLLTNYRFMFVTTVPDNVWSIPLTLISKLEVVDLLYLRITTKLGLSLSCEFEDDTTCELWLGCITRAADRTSVLEDSFCFRFRGSLQCVIPEHPFLFGANKLLWGATECSISDIGSRSGPNLVCRELSRMGFNEAWKVTDANKSFKICPSYPEYHIVPRDVEDSVIAKIADFRTNRRFPSVVWRSQTTGAVLLRCSQPCVGLMGYRNEFDEQFMCNVSRSCQKNPGSRPINGPKRLLIVDARTFRVAQLRRLLGGGYEHTAYYDDAEICFMDLPNLHKVRLSFESLIQLYAMDSDASWFSLLEKTYWLTYVSQLLKCSVDIATELESVGRLVMIHCTDGWDRTAQLSSLAQLLSDPYYRTIQGFAVLVEREWLQFGHKFADRCGQGGLNPSNPGEQSPIFLEWLDCVHQVRLQFPHEFQFNELFLVKLAVHVYSGLFGTFLCNSEQSRQEAQIASKTCSVWGLLSHRFNWTVVNPSYQPSGENILKPDWKLSCLRLWNSLYRNALLPSCRSSIGVISLNSVPASMEPETTDSVGHVHYQADAPAELTINTGPGAVSCTDYFHTDETVSPKDCCADRAESDLPVRINEPLKQSEAVDLPIKTTCLNSLRRNFLSDLTNTPFSDTELSALDTKCESHLRIDNNVATLSVSSTNDDNPLALNAPITPGIDLTDYHRELSDASLSRLGCPRLPSISSRDDLFLSYRRSCISPRPRGSFSTDNGSGVFFPDEDLDSAFPVQVTSPSHRASLIIGQYCASDDESLAKWDDCTSHVNDLTTASIKIQPKTDCTGLLNSVTEKPNHKRVDPVPSQRSQCNRTEVDVFDGPICEGSMSSWSYSATKVSTPGLDMKTVAVDCTDMFEAAHSGPSDYTVHSLPEGGAVLVGELSSDLEISSAEFPTETNGASIQIDPQRFVEDDFLGEPDEIDDCYPRWRHMYFMRCVIGTPSSLSKTESQEVRLPLAPLAISVDASCRDSRSLNQTNARPVSAPSSPILPEARPSVFCSQPATALPNPVCNVQAGSVVNIHPSNADRGCCPLSHSAIVDNLSIDWDGLPSLVDERARANHIRTCVEQSHLKMQITKLTEELTELRAKLARISLRPEEAKRNSVTSLSPQSSHLTTARYSDHSNRFSRRSSPDSTPSIPRPALDTSEVSRTIVPALGPVEALRDSNHLEISSYELVHPLQVPTDILSEADLTMFPCTTLMGTTTVCSRESVRDKTMYKKNASPLYRNSSEVSTPNGLPGSGPMLPESDMLIEGSDSQGSLNTPLDLLRPLSDLHRSNSSRFPPLQFCSSASLLSAASAGHFPGGNSISRSPSSRCRSAASGTESTASPAASDGLAQA